MVDERAREAPSSVPPPQKLGRYTLVHRLGTGGMGEVWLARQEGLAGGRPVAVKRMLTHLAYDARASQMFLDEARIASQLSHPNIVQIYDVGREDETYYLVMEFVLGENCARIIERAKKRKVPIPTVLAARICAEAAKALSHAHTRTGPGGRPLGIVHRDVTPPNIMVTEEGEVKLLDFGIAKAVDRVARTEAGNVKGKVEYLSPEQVEGGTIDQRADIFALGAVLFELCAGKKLFGRETMVATLAAVSECKVTPPSKLAPHVDPRVDEIVLRATAKRAVDRYKDAAEMREALVELLRGRETRAGSAELAQFVADLFRDEHQKRKQFLDAVYSAERAPSEVRRASSLGQRADPLAKAIDRALDAEKPRTFEGGSEEPTQVSPVHKSSRPAPVLEEETLDNTPLAKNSPPAPLAVAEQTTADKTPALRPSEPQFALESVSLPSETPENFRRAPSRSLVLVGGGLLSLAVAGAIVGGTLFYRHAKQPAEPSFGDPSGSDEGSETATSGVIVLPEMAIDPGPPEDAGVADAAPRVILVSAPIDAGLQDAGKKKPRFTTTSTKTERKRRGTLNVVVRGGGEDIRAGVLLDGEWVGLSPVEIRAEVGPHLIEIRQDGWRSQKRGVAIEAGKAASIIVDVVKEGAAQEPTAEEEEPPPPQPGGEDEPKKKKKKKAPDLESEVEIEVTP